MPVARMGVIANPRLDTSRARAPLNHQVAVLLRHAVRRAGETPRRAKQRPILVVSNSRR